MVLDGSRGWLWGMNGSGVEGGEPRRGDGDTSEGGDAGEQ